jgi:hypothetical protein
MDDVTVEPDRVKLTLPDMANFAFTTFGSITRQVTA